MTIDRAQLKAPIPKDASSGTEEGARDFDFLHGRWDVRHFKLRDRLAGCGDWYEFPGILEVGSVLGGLGNFDRNQLGDPLGPYEAHSLRLFRPATGAWSIHWLDGRCPGAGLGPAVVGGFSSQGGNKGGAKGTFLGRDEHAGRAVEVRTTYEPLGADRAEWTQAFCSQDHPEWEVNWIMQFSRVTA